MTPPEPPSLPSLATVPVVGAAEVLARPAGALVIDLRTPAEFADDHLPGAVNVPLLDDAGRALVGLAYTQESPEAGFRHGQALIEGRIDDLVRQVGELAGWQPPALDPVDVVRAATAEGIEALDARVAPESGVALRPGTVVLHCWRGGLRSRSVVGLLRALGLERAVGLEGGYKAYRTAVRSELDAWPGAPTFVLRGLTGVGKTLVLREVARLRPDWVLDLEGCAGHRSSLLGMVGLEPTSQKTFESLLAARLRHRPEGPLVLEGESRKVGDVIIPPALWSALDSGTNLLLEADVERRIQVLAEDYLARPSAIPLLKEQLLAVQERMGGERDLPGLLDAGEIDALVGDLLVNYYDPLYRHSEKGRDYATRIDSTNPSAAARSIVEWIEAQDLPAGSLSPSS